MKLGVGALGALAGFVYWKLYGCTEGCAITSNMYLTTGYGFLLGYLFTSSFENVLVKDTDQTSTQ